MHWRKCTLLSATLVIIIIIIINIIIIIIIIIVAFGQKKGQDKTRSGADLNGENLRIYRAYLRISFHWLGIGLGT